MFEYINKADRVLWLRYVETLSQKKHCEKFLQTLRKPDEKHKDELKAHENVVYGIRRCVHKQFTVVLTQATRFVQPSEGSLHYPTLTRFYILRNINATMHKSIRVTDESAMITFIVG